MDQPTSHTSADARLGRIRFVLVETSLTGNIGAVARAMKNMGLSRLALVRPRRLPDADAFARAAGADDLLGAASVHDSLSEALAGCRLAIGSSARPRTVEWPMVDPPRCARRLLDEAAGGDVALVLGRESSGLTNDELACCQYLVQIPTNPAFSSLNVAAAAQVFAYEIRRALLAAGDAPPAKSEPVAPEKAPATLEQMEGFYDHLLRTLIMLGFADPDQCRKLERRLRRLFNRARPDRTELNILRGILSAAEGRKSPERFRDRSR
jgi:tRNA (cytidine32/uridine32-2'-O)-methyltransferase